MKLITRDTDYALRALSFIAKKGEKKVSVAEMAQKLMIPRPFLRKILQVLHKRGILNAYKGLGGGFSLALPPSKIYLTDLMQIFQGRFRLNECLLKKLRCPHIQACPLRRKVDKIEHLVFKELQSVTIASLLR